MKWAVAIVIVVGAGCATAAVMRGTRGVDDFPTAHVRIYQLDHGWCRVEVITTTATILTGVSRCQTVIRP